MSRADEITGYLRELKEGSEHIAACMVARKGLEGLIMFPPDFKQEVSNIWEPLSRNLNDMLSLVSKYSEVGLKRSYTEMLGFGALFSVLGASDTALIVFLKGGEPLKNAVQLSDDMEETRDKIMNLD